LGFASTLTFDLHEYEDLKDQLFKFVFFLLNCKKKQKKNIVDQVQRKQIYIGKKSNKRRIKKRSSTQLLLQFICDLLISTCNQSFF